MATLAITGQHAQRNNRSPSTPNDQVRMPTTNAKIMAASGTAKTAMSPKVACSQGSASATATPDANTAPIKVPRVRHRTGASRRSRIGNKAIANEYGLVTCVTRPYLRYKATHQSGKISRTHQVTITLARRAAAFIDGPHHQALTTTAIARREHALQAGVELPMFSLDVAAWIGCNF